VLRAEGTGGEVAKITTKLRGKVPRRNDRARFEIVGVSVCTRKRIQKKTVWRQGSTGEKKDDK